jgi:hypothetical protein
VKRIDVPQLNHRSPISVSASGTAIASCPDVDVDIPPSEVPQCTANR